jgi:hypothetical protein
MRNLSKKIFFLALTAGWLWLAAMRLRDIFLNFGFQAGVGWGIIGLGAMIIFGAIAVKQTLEVSRRGDRSN